MADEQTPFIKKVYRGSRHDDLPESPGFGGYHFGTEKAAQDRLDYTSASAPQSLMGKERIDPFEITLNNPYGTEQNPISETELYQILNVPRIGKEFKEKGFDGIIYKNIAEDPGSLSYLVFNKENIRPLDEPRSTDLPITATEKRTGKKVARIPPKVMGGIMRALRNVPGYARLGVGAYEAATAAWDLLSKPQQEKLIRQVYPPLPKEGGIADLPMGEEESPFQKPSDLIHQAQEPTVEDIRRVLAEHTDLLMGPSLPVTENRMRMFEAARRKHGPESTRWGENWEEAGRELGFETDAELRTLINDIYDVQGRGPFVPGMPKDDPRYEFWALEGPAFERTVQNILEKRSERESYIKGGKAAGGFIDKPLYDRAV